MRQICAYFGISPQAHYQKRRRQRITMGAIIAGLILAIGLGIFAWLHRNVAVQERDQRATAQAVAIHEANTRATAEWEAISEAKARSTAESAAITESNARATAQAEAEEQVDEAQQQANISLSRALSTQSLEQQSI
jgi:FtsZ-interacting cell division protein ZipA